MDSLKLVYPFTLILAGPSGSGKSQFVKKLIENKMIKPFPKKMIWCYGVYQALYEEMSNISFHEGIPSNLHQYSDALIVVDDLMDATSKPYGLWRMFRGSGGEGFPRIRFPYVPDRLVWKGNAEDRLAVNFRNQYVTGYLLIDLKPETDESLRVRTGFNTEEEKVILYLQVLQKYMHFSNENRKESESVPNETSLSENQETESLKENLKESVVKMEKEVFEDEILMNCSS
ncbi:uncharacterized protein TNCV_3619951 [Trichonephila clavipes]|nr:uncharacterized protein TNCV_3619951 [Trichonephila clavipes]